MNLATYSRDLSQEGPTFLKSAMEKWGLKMNELLSRKDKLVLENGQIVISLVASEDYFNIDFLFYETSLGEDYTYALYDYLNVIFEDSKPIAPPKVLFDEKDFDRWLGYYNSILLEFFNSPLSGDFSWKAQYFERIDLEKRIDEFFASLPWGNSKKMEIKKKRIQNDPTWLDDAKALYKEIHGKDLE